jgi:predicted secreted protein
MKYNGDNLLLVVDGVVVAGTRSFTLTINQTNFSTTTKDDQGWETNKPGNRNWNVAFDGLLDPAGNFNAEEIYDLIDGRDDCYLEMAVIEGGGLVFRGTAHPNGLVIGAPQGEAATLSGGFDGTGPIAKGTVVSS